MTVTIPKTFTIALFAVLMVIPVFGQTETDDKPSENDIPEHVSSSPAFAEVVYRRAILEAELEELRVRYTDEFPKVVELRTEIEELDSSMKKLLAVEEEESSKLSQALGKLLVQRAVYATELSGLKSKYSPEHPDVKRAATKLAIFEKAIKRIF